MKTLTSTVQERAHGWQNAAWGVVMLGRRAVPYATVPVLLIVLLVGAYCTPAVSEEHWSIATATPPVAIEQADQFVDLIAQAESDPVSVLVDALDRYDENIVDYTGRFTRQEVYNGQLQPRVVSEFKFREAPFSVAMHLTQGAGRADRAVFVEGQNQGKMLVHPTGVLGRIIPCASVDPDGEEARRNSSRTIREFGIRNMLTALIERYQAGGEEGQLQAECLGVYERGGMRVLVLRASDDLGSVLAELDLETLLPVHVRTFTPDGEPTSMFMFEQLQFNQGLDDQAFSRQANGLGD